MKRSRERRFYLFILLGALLFLGSGQTQARERVRVDGIVESRESHEEDGFDQGYVSPVPPADMHVYDKSLPFSEVMRKISSPSYLFWGPELEEGLSCGPFPLPLNQYVQAYVEYFSGPARRTFATWLRRSGLYRDMILSELRRRGMPEELLYLCMIESGFNPKITSWAGARGLWQFIPSTGRRYGLQQNYWVDERCDPEKSTRAALDYLSDNYRMFGDWHLAAAAYNTGEYNVDRALKRTDSASYWELVEQRALARETRDYLPKMIAAAIIGNHPEQYGFYNIQYLPPFRYSTVTVDNAVDLRVIAQCAGTSTKEIEWLNPELIQFCTPPGSGGYKVHIPPGRTNEFRRAYALLKPEEKTSFKTHTVQRGETIRSIAAGYQTSAKMLASMNGLSRDSQLKEGQVLIVPVPKDRPYDPSRTPPPVVEPEPSDQEVASRDEGHSRTRTWRERRESAEEADNRTRKSQKGRESTRTSKTGSKESKVRQKKYYYTLQPGETLWDISRRTGIPLEDLKRWNNIQDPSTLNYGDTIVIYAPEEGEPESAGASLSPGSASRKTPTATGGTRTISFTVREGDRCYLIARHYGINQRDIIQRNHLDSRCTLKPGQTISLVVPKEAPRSLPPVERPRENLAPRPKSKSCKRSPKDEAPASTAAKKTTTNSKQKSAAAKRVSYTVKDGDSLWRIARAHNVHVSEVKSWNNMKSDSVKPGQTLVIYPSPPASKEQNQKKDSKNNSNAKTNNSNEKQNGKTANAASSKKPATTQPDPKKDNPKNSQTAAKSASTNKSTQSASSPKKEPTQKNSPEKSKSTTKAEPKNNNSKAKSTQEKEKKKTEAKNNDASKNNNQKTQTKKGSSDSNQKKTAKNSSPQNQPKSNGKDKSKSSPPAKNANDKSKNNSKNSSAKKK